MFESWDTNEEVCKMILVLMDTMIKALGATWRVTAPEQAGGEEQAEGGGSPVDGDGGASAAEASTAQSDGSLEEEYEKLKEGGTIVISMAWEDEASETASEAELRKKKEEEKGGEGKPT